MCGGFDLLSPALATEAVPANVTVFDKGIGM